MVNKKNGYSSMIHRWVIDECQRSHRQTAEPATNMIFVDVVDGQERKQNASYVNPTNARFVAELVSRLAASAPMFSAKSYMDDRFDTERYKGKKGQGKDQDREKREKDREERIQQFLRTYEWGRILIVTGYSEQKRLLLETLAELPEAEVPPGLVSVQTIDNSPSHEAEVVICDMIRTDKPGFMVEDARLAVMTTRARALTIIVGKSDVIKGKDARSLRALHDYLKDRDAIVKVLGGTNSVAFVCSRVTRRLPVKQLSISPSAMESMPAVDAPRLEIELSPTFACLRTLPRWMTSIEPLLPRSNMENSRRESKR